MSVKIDSILFQDSYTGTYSGGADTGADFLMGCVGDFMYATIDFHVSWSILDSNIDFSSSDKTLTLKPCGLLTADWIQAGFSKGDTIAVVDSASNDGNFTITDITSNVIIVAEAVANESASGVNVYGTTAVHAIDFFYNLTQNTNQRRQPLGTAWGPNNPARLSQNSNFNSITDPNSIQKYSGIANIYYGGYAFMEPNATSLAWYTDTVDGINCKPKLTFLGTSADYKQQYQIVFPFLITPFFTANQLSLLQNAYAQSKSTGVNLVDLVPPELFNQLQFVYQIDAKYTTNQRIINHTTDINETFEESNISWFNSFFPSGVYDYAGNLLTQSQFKFVSIVYTDNLGNVITEIDFNQETNVVLKYTVTSGSPSRLIDSLFVLNFAYAPGTTNEYQGYSAAHQGGFRKAFLHDRAVTSEGGATVNGDKFGTAFQAITGCSATHGGGNVTVSFKINLGATSKAVFENASEQNRNYLLWVTPQSNTATEMVNSNRSAIIADVNLATTNTDDGSLFSIVTNNQSDVYFYKCDDCNEVSDLANPETAFNDYVGGYGISYAQFKVKKGSIIKSIKTSFEVQVRVAATSVLLGSFPVEEWNNDTSSFWDGTLTQINIDQPRTFPLPTDDLRNTRKIYRQTNLDTSEYYFYSLIYGFQLGYQYWQSVLNYYEVFNRYHTNYWAVYSQGYVGKTTDSDFVRIVPTTETTAIKFKIVAEIYDTTTGVATEFIRYCDVNCFDEHGNAATYNLSINTLDKYGNSLSGVISEEFPTTAACSISASSLATPVGYSPLGELIAYYTSGGTEIYDRVSSDDAGVRAGSIWNELPNVLIDTVSNVGKIVAELDVNNLALPVNNLRIYSKLTFVK